MSGRSRAVGGRCAPSAAAFLLAAVCVGGCGFSASPRGENAPSQDAAPPKTPPPASARPGGARPANARLPHLQSRPAPRAPHADDWFEDRAAAAGLNFAYRDGSEAGHYQLLESVGGGVALFDFDADGQIDVFLPGGGAITSAGAADALAVAGRAAALFRNVIAEGAPGAARFANVTSAAGLGDASLYTHGAAAADFNNDGFVDLFVAGYGGCRLFVNQGDGVFVERAIAAGVVCPDWNVTGVWADFNRDGALDLYVVTYADWKPDPRRQCVNDQGLVDICGPTLFAGARDRVFLSQGDGGFADVTGQAGVVPKNRGLGAVAADFDADGWLDVYVVNDVEENQLYLGGAAFPFRNEADLAGAAFSPLGEREGSMGVDVGDYNADGHPDIWYANYANQDNSLLRNNGVGGFFPATAAVGLQGVSRPWVGFGAGFADFNGDGWPELFVCNGHVAYERRDSPYFQPAQVFRNAGGERFVEVSAQGGPYFSAPRAGRGAAVGDLDDDGALDLVVSHQNDPAAWLRNRLPQPPWLRLRLVGVVGPRDAIGARLAVDWSGRRRYYWTRGGGGYLSTFDARVTATAPADADPLASARVVVTWPSGAREAFANLPPRRTHDLVEGSGEVP